MKWYRGGHESGKYVVKVLHLGFTGPGGEKIPSEMPIGCEVMDMTDEKLPKPAQVGIVRERLLDPCRHLWGASPDLMDERKKFNGVKRLALALLRDASQCDSLSVALYPAFHRYLRTQFNADSWLLSELTILRWITRRGLDGQAVANGTLIF